MRRSETVAVLQYAVVQRKTICSKWMKLVHILFFFGMKYLMANCKICISISIAEAVCFTLLAPHNWLDSIGSGACKYEKEKLAVTVFKKLSIKNLSTEIKQLSMCIKSQGTTPWSKRCIGSWSKPLRQKIHQLPANNLHHWHPTSCSIKPGQLLTELPIADTNLCALPYLCVKRSHLDSIYLYPC